MVLVKIYCIYVSFLIKELASWVIKTISGVLEPISIPSQLK